MGFACLMIEREWSLGLPRVLFERCGEEVREAVGRTLEPLKRKPLGLVVSTVIMCTYMHGGALFRCPCPSDPSSEH